MTQIGDFGFTTVVANNLPNGTVTGYAEAFCPGESFPYVPPSGWIVQSCTYVGMGVDGSCSSCGCSEITCSPVSTSTTPTTTTTSSVVSVLATTTSTTATTSVIAAPSQPTTCTVSGSAQSSFCDGVNYFVCTSGTWDFSQANSTQCGYVTPAATTPTTPIPATTPTTTTQTPASPTTTSVCSENTQQCSGTTLFICSNGGWIDVEQNSPSCGYVAPGTGTGSSPGAGTNQGSTTFGIDTTTLMYIGLGAVAILGLAMIMGGRKRGSSPPPAAPSTPK